MSYINDKIKCQGDCGLLYDADLLNANGKCRDCVNDEAMLAELNYDYAKEHGLAAKE